MHISLSMITALAIRSKTHERACSKRYDVGRTRHPYLAVRRVRPR